MTTTHDKLTALSEAATQGPWVADGGSIYGKDFGYTVPLLEYFIEVENERGGDDIAFALALVNAWRDGSIIAKDGLAGMVAEVTVDTWGEAPPDTHIPGVKVTHKSGVTVAVDGLGQHANRTQALRAMAIILGKG